MIWASAGTVTSPLLPTAANLPERMTMAEFSIGRRPVPSISVPPTTARTGAVCAQAKPLSGNDSRTASETARARTMFSSRSE